MTEGDEQSGLVSVAVVSSLYVAAQLLSNVTSLRILRVAGFSMDAGTLIYPFTFTLRDLVHKSGGIRVARRHHYCGRSQPVHGRALLARGAVATGHERWVATGIRTGAVTNLAARFRLDNRSDCV